MDIADWAEATEALEREHAIEAARGATPARATGRCLNCGEPLAQGLRWCDTDCRDDWARRVANY